MKSSRLRVNHNTETRQETRRVHVRAAIVPLVLQGNVEVQIIRQSYKLAGLYFLEAVASVVSFMTCRNVIWIIRVILMTHLSCYPLPQG